MNCLEVSLRIAGAEPTTPEERSVVAEHVFGCPACRERTAYLRWLGEELAALPRAGAPAGLAETVLARVGVKRPASAPALAEARYSVFASPVGPLYVAYGDGGIVRAAFALDETQFRALLRSEGRVALRDETPPAAVAAAVQSFFQSGRCRPDAFDLRLLGEFERRVLAKALEIPRGEVRSYAWIAREIGYPGAARAVGQALGRNPIPLLIPCHRAVRSDGSLGGYAFGLELKRQLLAAEGIDLPALAADARARVRFYGSRTTGIFCLPTCHAARRIAPHNRVPFRSEKEAARAGFRACRLCRPVGAEVAV